MIGKGNFNDKFLVTLQVINTMNVVPRKVTLTENDVLNGKMI